MNVVIQIHVVAVVAGLRKKKMMMVVMERIRNHGKVPIGVDPSLWYSLRSEPDEVTPS